MIWLVTDNPATADALSPLISRKGYSVHPIACGDDAPRRLRLDLPKLVIIDCGAKGSFETLDGLRTEPRLKHLPVLMFSTDDQNLKEQALLRGADGYVAKGSLDWAELLAEIARLAGKPQ